MSTKNDSILLDHLAEHMLYLSTDWFSSCVVSIIEKKALSGINPTDL